jgi:predicted RNase H-like HicB family nuclease
MPCDRATTQLQPGKLPLLPVDGLSVEENKFMMNKRFTMLYWKGEKFWAGMFLEFAGRMTQGESLEELEENLREAYSLMVMEDIPEDYQTKEIVI